MVASTIMRCVENSVVGLLLVVVVVLTSVVNSEVKLLSPVEVSRLDTLAFSVVKDLTVESGSVVA